MTLRNETHPVRAFLDHNKDVVVDNLFQSDDSPCDVATCRVRSATLTERHVKFMELQ